MNDYTTQPAKAMSDIMDEYDRAVAKFPTPFNSGHEGIAVLEEEFLELKNEVYWGPSDRADPILFQGNTPAELKSINASTRMKLMRAEAVQTAAMALRFIIDVCDREPSNNTGETNG